MINNNSLVPIPAREININMVKWGDLMGAIMHLLLQLHFVVRSHEFVQNNVAE